jgi:NitT/TauT family transport system substrate-binding protein
VIESTLYAPLYLATEGLFAQEGLDVQIVSFPSGTRMVGALAGGSIDVAVGGLDAMVAAIAAEHPIRVFYAPWMSMGFTWVARPGVTSWGDLRGRSVGISSSGSLTDGLTRYVLRRHGLEPERDVALIQLGEVSTRLAALRAGRVDATLVGPPTTYAALRLGLPVLGIQRLEVGQLWPQAVMATRTRLLDERPAALRSFLRAYVRGVRGSLADHDGTVTRLMTRLKFGRADVEAAWTEARPTFDERGAPPAAGLALFWQILAITGEAPQPWPETRFLDRRFVDTFDDWAPPR